MLFRSRKELQRSTGRLSPFLNKELSSTTSNNVMAATAAEVMSDEEKPLAKIDTSLLE